MPAIDPYNDPDSQADTTLQSMITRLEERGRHPGFLRMIRDYALTLPQERPLTVLDLGCGTGVVIRQLMEILHPSSVLHGADISNGLLNEARKLAPDERIRWDHVPFGKLPYNDASFDAITMHTLLSHVPDPVAVLDESARILKPSGRLIVFDADHAGTTYGQPDYETTRRIDYLLTSAIATHPDICRQMPRYLQATGFELQSHRSEMISECGRGDYWLSSVRGFARMIPALGILSPEETQAWVGHMLGSHENGTFFAAGAFYTFHAQRG
jgi:ubiquinone/menaquinone biosynthesis C-methylase UbiE